MIFPRLSVLFVFRFFSNTCNKKHSSKNVSFFKARGAKIYTFIRFSSTVVYVATRHTLTERPIATTTTTTPFEKKKKRRNTTSIYRRRIWCDDAKVISSLIENDDDDDVDDGDTNKIEF